MWLPAGALTSELLFPLSNLGITDATPLQPHSYHVKKFPQPHLSVNERENSHQDSHVCAPPTSSQSSVMFGSIAHPIQLEQEHVGASASNHEVKDEYSIWCRKAILCLPNCILYRQRSTKLVYFKLFIGQRPSIDSQSNLENMHHKWQEIITPEITTKSNQIVKNNK